MVARTIEHVFKTIRGWDERTAAVTVSFIEVVGENVYDLLALKKCPITIVDNGKTFELKVSFEGTMTSVSKIEGRDQKETTGK